MPQVYPDYYKKFRCIADRCRHNCCIGWEIDIDDCTAQKYKNVSGNFGKRLDKHISKDIEPHFILGTDERCPFLNKQNLCDIIIELGEENLCTICSEHPRFHNELPDRIESGLGLCCEAAAELILGQKEPMTLICNEELQYDEVINLRDEIISILQNRNKTLEERIAEMLSHCGAQMPQKNISEWIELLRSLERLDNEWTELLDILKNEHKNADIKGFNKFMALRHTEYEQLTVYLIYRHFANASDISSAASRANFAAFGFWLIHLLGAVIWTKTGDFTFYDQVNIVRLFSSEIEYSDENFYILLDELNINYDF